MNTRNRQSARLRRGRTRLSSESQEQPQSESRAPFGFGGSNGESPPLLSSQGVGTVALGAFAASVGTFIAMQSGGDQ